MAADTQTTGFMLSGASWCRSVSAAHCRTDDLPRPGGRSARSRGGRGRSQAAAAHPELDTRALEGLALDDQRLRVDSVRRDAGHLQEKEPRSIDSLVGETALLLAQRERGARRIGGL